MTGMFQLRAALFMPDLYVYKKSPGHHALGFLTLFITDRSTGSTRADERGY